MVGSDGFELSLGLFSSDWTVRRQERKLEVLKIVAVGWVKDGDNFNLEGYGVNSGAALCFVEGWEGMVRGELRVVPKTWKGGVAFWTWEWRCHQGD
jgi:hypothetical protein